MKKWSDILPRPALQRASTLASKAQVARASATIYPPQSQIFSALTLTPPEKVRVVIVGQDPYHGQGQANGLAFTLGRAGSSAFEYRPYGAGRTAQQP